MADINDLANTLFGTHRTSSSNDITETATVYGTAVSNSVNGMVLVKMDGETSTPEIDEDKFSEWKSEVGDNLSVIEKDNNNIVEVLTSPEVKAGDSVIVTIVGTSVLKKPFVSAVIGSGDRTSDAAEAAQAAADNEAERAKNEEQAMRESFANEMAQAQKDVNTQIAAVQKDISDFKATADATYSTKTETDDKTGAITKTLEADYLKKDDAATTYTEKTVFEESINSLKTTMTSNYSSFTDYKTSNDKAVADAKKAGTDASSALNNYKSSNDAALKNTTSTLNDYMAATDQTITALSNIADNAIESWYLSGVPTTSNDPAKNWTSADLKSQHAGDIYFDVDSGYSYRWTGSEWIRIQDSDISKALGEITTIKTDYATKSELSATDSELKASISDTLTQAKTYSSGLVSQEQIDRDAAIKASADSITQSVSQTYTTVSTFNSYKTSNDKAVSDTSSALASYKTSNDAAVKNASTAASNAQSSANTANSKIDNLQIGGRNLVLKSDTQNRSASSTSYPAGVYELSSKLTSGSTYTWTVWGTFTNAKYIDVYFGGGIYGTGFISIPSDGYLILHKTFVATANIANQTSAYVYVRDAANTPSIGSAKAIISRIKIELGNKSTDWTPAPEDTDSDISAVASDLSGFKTTVSTTYATKSELKTTNDSITAEVSARKQTDTTVTNLSNNLSQNYSTTTQMNSAIQVSATNITNTVAATYATQNSVSTLSTKVEQNATSISTIFTQGTGKTLKDTTDTISTLIRLDSTGVSVGQSSDGKTYSKGHSVVTSNGFLVYDSSNKEVASFSGNAVKIAEQSDYGQIDMLNGNFIISGSQYYGSDVLVTLKAATLNIDTEYSAGISLQLPDSSHKEGTAQPYTTPGASLYLWQDDGIAGILYSSYSDPSTDDIRGAINCNEGYRYSSGDAKIGYMQAWMPLYTSGNQPPKASGAISFDYDVNDFDYIIILGSSSEWKRGSVIISKTVCNGRFDNAYFTLMCYNGSNIDAYLKFADYRISINNGKTTMTPIAYNEIHANGNSASSATGIGIQVVQVIGLFTK